MCIVMGYATLNQCALLWDNSKKEISIRVDRHGIIAKATVTVQLNAVNNFGGLMSKANSDNQIATWNNHTACGKNYLGRETLKFILVDYSWQEQYCSKSTSNHISTVPHGACKRCHFRGTLSRATFFQAPTSITQMVKLQFIESNLYQFAPIG